MKLGVIQGRLSKPIKGFQECPDDWEREFNLLSDLNLTHIEWIVTKNSFNNNPLFTENLSQYPISSICADNLISRNIIDPIFLFNNLQPICIKALQNNISTITIPLLEESDMSNIDVRTKFIKNINEFAVTYYPEIIFSFEIESYEDTINDIINSNDNFRLTYDTGNMTSLGISHEYYISKFINKIDTVHLKDRTFEGTTVIPGEGKTNFKEIFKSLKNYKGKYTLQTAREITGNEINTIKSHKKYLVNLKNSITY